MPKNDGILEELSKTLSFSDSQQE